MGVRTLLVALLVPLVRLFAEVVPVVFLVEVFFFADVSESPSAEEVNFFRGFRIVFCASATPSFSFFDAEVLFVLRFSSFSVVDDAEPLLPAALDFDRILTSGGISVGLVESTFGARKGIAEWKAEIDRKVLSERKTAALLEEAYNRSINKRYAHAKT